MDKGPALDIPNTTLKLLNNLGLAIDEARLVRIIIKLDSKAKNIESKVGISMKTKLLREEVKYLESKLVLLGVRNQKSVINAEQVFIKYSLLLAILAQACFLAFYLKCSEFALTGNEQIGQITRFII